MLVRFHRAPLYSATPGALFDFEREIGELFDGFLGTGRRTSEFFPALDIAEQDGESVVVAELPGVKREDVKITVRDGALTLSAERNAQTLPEDGRWIRNEIPAGRFSRTVSLPHDVDTDGVTAELKNGILRVVLPKAASARPKEIKVQ
jgi:HSP20 family protein